MSSKTQTFNDVWNRIIRFKGEEFETKTHLPFTYEIKGKVFRSNRTEYNISKSDFEKAFAQVPLDGPGKISGTVRGSAYVWAVLHDKRVSKGDW